MSYDDLAQTLRIYGFQCDHRALRDAFSHGPEPAEWVRRHLIPETLLSRHELDQYNALIDSPKAAQLDLDAARPIAGDADLRAAIDELNRSTAAVSKHAETLRQQQDALARIVGQDSKSADARADMASRRTRSAEAERHQLAVAVEVLAQSLSSRLAHFEQQQSGVGGLRHTVDDLLSSDDKLLTSLQRLGWELEAEDPEEHEGVARLRETCARLIKFTVETLRTKLDRMYLEALESGVKHCQASADDVAEMQAELEELYTEILPVAQMSVEQQFLEPAVRSLTGRSAVNLARSVEALDYVDACLEYLLHNMTVLSTRVQAGKAHESATSTILATAKSELSTHVETTPKPRARAATLAALTSPTRRGNLTIDASPIRPRRANTLAAHDPRRRRHSSDIPDESPLDVVLRTIALSLPEDDDSSDVTALAGALRDRTIKASDMAGNVQASFEAATAAHLVDAAAAVDMVRDSVLADGSNTALADTETENLVWVLQQEVAQAKGRLADVEAELNGREGKAGRREGKREEMVRRWGSRR